jgi:hypothetical protein
MSGMGMRETRMRLRWRCAHRDVERGELGRLVRIVVAEVAAAAFAPFDGRPRDRLGDGQQVAQVRRVCQPVWNSRWPSTPDASRRR